MLMADKGEMLTKVIAKLSEEVQEGLRHGYFQCEVTVETIAKRKRRLNIKAGKNYQFVLSEEESVGIYVITTVTPVTGAP
jgi:hypothetical protein